MDSIKKKDKKTIIIKERSWWHVRKYFKSGHAALIVGENEDEFAFLNITKNPPNGYSYFETKNPISLLEKKKSHIRLYLQIGKKKRFSKWLMKYEFSKEDLEKVESFLNKTKSA